MPETAEKPIADDQQSPLPEPPAENDRPSCPGRSKATLLPQIRDLALEGHSCREIAARLALGKSTVNRWLQELRREQSLNFNDQDGMILNAIARYDSIYRESMEAWRDSKVDREVRLVESTEVAGQDGGSKKKESVRTERRSGDIAFLAQARDAVDRICKLREL